MAPDDVMERLATGAALVQLYTGLVYAGPGLLKRSLEKLGE
jgi:dihydroorotate dehydrogenase